MSQSQNQPPLSQAHRIVTAAFGAFFIILAVLIVALSELTAGVIVAAVVVGGLGLDALVNAWRNRQSLLSRIGPLP